MLIASQACANDALIGDIMHPYRKEYPEDFVEFFHRRLCRYLHDSTRSHVVSYELQGDAEVITGYADWLHQDGSHEEPHASTVHPGNFFRAGSHHH